VKGYKIFIWLGLLLLLLYIVAEVNKPKPVNWVPTLSKNDKNPYGAYILYQQLPELFKGASISAYREPLYNKLHKTYFENSVYIILSPEVGSSKLDLEEACRFVENGNYIFLSAFDMIDKLLDTLGLKLSESFTVLRDSVSVNFTSPSVRSYRDYTSPSTINGYFSSLNKPDSTVILGTNNRHQPNFIKVNCGDGAFFIHADPLCFSNYFLMHNNNSEYVAKAFSYIPSTVNTVFWDEYYKSGRTGASTPLRFFLSDEWLQWALWLALAGLVVFVLFDMKRKQRIIPVIPPLRNTTLDFVKTISTVYFNQGDNKGIAEKKFRYWLEFVRQRFFISTQQLDEEFIKQLSKKSGMSIADIQKITGYAVLLAEDKRLSDASLMEISNSIDSFYQFAK